MPTYRCLITAGSAADARRAEIAKAITNAHHQVTGAPSYFAQVIFDRFTEGDVFVGGEPPGHEHIYVQGFIRDGRSAVDRSALLRRLAQDVAVAAGVAPRVVWVYLAELPARHMIELGEVLPEAGEEAAWAERLPSELRAWMEGHGAP